jgi:hypothetical protein
LESLKCGVAQFADHGPSPVIIRLVCIIDTGAAGLIQRRAICEVGSAFQVGRSETGSSFPQRADLTTKKGFFVLLLVRVGLPFASARVGHRPESGDGTTDGIYATNEGICADNETLIFAPSLLDIVRCGAIPRPPCRAA